METFCFSLLLTYFALEKESSSTVSERFQRFQTALTYAKIPMPKITRQRLQYDISHLVTFVLQLCARDATK